MSMIYIVGCNVNGGNIDTVDDSKNIFPVTKIQMRDTFVYIDYVADIHALQNVELRARVKGYLDKIHVDEGQFVKKGQILFSINDEEYQVELARARAQLKSAISEAKSAELEVERVSVLVKNAVITKSELELAKAKWEATKAKVDEAKASEAQALLKINHAHIKAPFDGTIDRIEFRVGSLIDEGTLLTTISDLSYVYAYFNVSEVEYLNLLAEENNEEKQTVKLVLANGEIYPHKGYIQTMESEFEESTGTIAFRAKFINPDKKLKHNSSGKVKIEKPIKNALFVPQRATFDIQDKSYVFVVDNSGIVKIKVFTPVMRLGPYYIVSGELSNNDKVVYEGIQNLKDGMQIKTKEFDLFSINL